MDRRRLSGLFRFRTLLWAGCCALASAPLAAGQLRTLALASGAQGTVLELKLTSAVAEKVFTLDNPRRVVIDLPATRRVRGLGVPAATGVVTAVRIGPQANGSLRVVLQLKGAAQYKLVRQSSAGAYALRVQLTGKAGPPAPRVAAAPAMMPAAAPLAESAAPAAAGQNTAAAATPAADGGGPADSAPDPVRTAPASGSDIVIAVDAGHGGEDPGATGPHGTHEKNVTLAIAKALAARINDEPGMRAVLTRDGDYFIPLRDRMVRARQARADLFISIHADAVRNRAVSGASVYVLSNRGASSEAAHWLAERENSADLKGGVSLANVNGNLASVLMDLSQSASQGASVEVADQVLHALDGVGVVRKPQVQYAAFVVLKSPDIPSLLIETAYISNPAEERRLAGSGGQQQLAQAIFGGLQHYFDAHPPAGSRYAQLRHPERFGGGAGNPQLVRNAP